MIREAELDDMRQELKKATEIDFEKQFRETIDPTGSLAESLKPPELPNFADAGLSAAPSPKAQPQSPAETPHSEAIEPAAPIIAPPHDASQDTVPLKQ
jgi:sec-independent protein translocase protein TatB